MQEAVKAKALELLQSGKADRVLGWKQGDFFYDETPAVFETPEEIESSFVFDLFSAPNLSKYLIQESRKGGVVAVFLKPCDSYSFQQLLKEHRILREHVYVVGVQCNGTSDGERLRMAGCRGVTAVKEGGGRAPPLHPLRRKAPCQKGRAPGALRRVQEPQARGLR